MPHNNLDLIKYRIERSFTTIKEAKDALDNVNLFNVQNRIYYACYYIVSALALTDNFSTSKHKQLIGWFNQNYIKNEIIPIKYGKFLKLSYEKRQESDYDDFLELSIEEVKFEFEEMDEFVNFLNKFINNKINIYL